MGLTLCYKNTAQSFVFKGSKPLEYEMQSGEAPVHIRSSLRLSSSEMKKIIAEQEKARASMKKLSKVTTPAGLPLKNSASEPSLKDRVRERQRRGYKFIENEEQAVSYMGALENSSMRELTETFTVVDSMITKGNDTCQELKRQGEVLRQANSDMHETEKDIADTSHRLKGMKSVRGKLANLVWSKPKHHGRSVSEGEQVTNTFKRSMTAPMILSGYSDSQTKQEWMTEGLKKLGCAMSILEEQQLSMKDEFETQEKYMNKLNHDMDNVEKSLLHQTNLMHSMKKE